MPPPAEPAVQDLVEAGVPVRLWTPAAWHAGSRLLAFSHGANANARKYDELSAALAFEGHAVAAVLHRDSPDHPAGSPPAQQEAWAARLSDMRVALSLLAARFPGRPMMAAGHSYGALVAQALAGARVEWGTDGGPVPEPRIARVLAFSPPGPLPGFVTAEGWAQLARPMLVVTGTADVLPMIAPSWEAHRVSFDASRVSPRWLWVGDGVDHYFGNRIGRPERPDDEGQAALFGAAIATAIAFVEGRDPPDQPSGATLTVA
ncbi:MAG: alpha/beta hydrolase [Sphingomonadaceae bacterium]